MTGNMDRNASAGLGRIGWIVILIAATALLLALAGLYFWADAPATPVLGSSPLTLQGAAQKHDAAVAAAAEQYLKDLHALLAEALQADDQAEAQRVNQIIAQVQRSAADVRDEATKARPLKKIREVNVPASEEWIETRARVQRGDVLFLTARGEWTMNRNIPDTTTFGPDGLRVDGTDDWHGRMALLMAKIGYRVYLVGRQAEIIVEDDGVVELRCNDFNLDDNVGAMQVTVNKIAE